MDTHQKRRQMLYISAIYALYYMAYTCAFSFMAVFLSGLGYKGSQVSIIYTVMSCINLLAQPIMGYLSDSKIPIKRLTLIMMGVAIPIGFVIPAVGGIYLLLVVMVPTLSFFTQTMVSLLDSWTYMAKETNDKITYSIARGMGSFSSAIIGLVVGRAMTQFGNGVIFTMHGIFMALAFVCALFFTNVPCRNVADDGKKGLSFFGAFKALASCKAYMLLLAGLFLLNIGKRAAISYMPLLITQFGGTSADQGNAVFMMTIAILPFMFMYPKLSRRFRPKHILIVACVLTAIRVITMAVVNSLPVLIYMQLLEGLTFGLYSPSLIDFVASVTPDKLRASALSVSATVQAAVCGIVSNALAGVFLEFLTLKAMFVTYSVIAVIGIGFVVLSTRCKVPKEELNGQ